MDAKCVICSDPIDYCQGHGESGWMVWEDHDHGDHGGCHPSGCGEAGEQVVTVVARLLALHAVAATVLDADALEAETAGMEEDTPSMRVWWDAASVLTRGDHSLFMEGWERSGIHLFA